MGKSSKSKDKKLAKENRAKHLKNVESFEKTVSTIDRELQILAEGRRRDIIKLAEEKLQLLLQVEESYALINSYQHYRHQLSEVCSTILFNQILLRNYNQASKVYSDMVKYPLFEDLKNCVMPFSYFVLLWTKRENVDRNDTIAKITEHAIDIIRTPKARYPIHFLFVNETLTVLSRQKLCKQHFKGVESVSLAMIRDIGEHEPRMKSSWVMLARTFFVFSHIDELRFSLLAGLEQVRFKAIVREAISSSSLRNLLQSDTGHLAHSLLTFYTYIFEEEEHSSEKAKEITDEYTESLKTYVSCKSVNTQRVLCSTCSDEDTADHEGLVCQGCRVVSYCCKDHQRLNYLHHEVTGTRGLGHKQLCPVFKAYRRKKDNSDTSKQGHLDRKFQRACKKFLRGTIQA
ncbi:predicted protein [Chaetoceros tenuissimus]|uniref:MYND-type domain-containing protein n=1 Tax=Chaetoceros tenuissimus TaxID=426638 RepID=A0AAD3DCL2_9STRA|nr:predicted protein [Chaetoceros tenuissimus]